MSQNCHIYGCSNYTTYTNVFIFKLSLKVGKVEESLQHIHFFLNSKHNYHSREKNMTYLTGYSTTIIRNNNQKPISSISIIITPNTTTVSSRYVVVFAFSTSSESVWTDFPIENAYELLEVSQTSSFDEIKASFRKLAKETHPDVAESRNDSTASKRFVQILAAYEVRVNRFPVFINLSENL